VCVGVGNGRKEGDGKDKLVKKKPGTAEGLKGEIVTVLRHPSLSLVPVYRSREDDVMWAHKGVFATFVNG
ncbi:hypothetical protein A2U01_0111401, partial [Trifolium medium]|nr:hypothetical protein [Trifolium medium]